MNFIESKYHLETTSKFKRDFKRMKKRNMNMTKLETVVNILLAGETPPEKYRDHALKGGNDRECHIEPDWLLVYQYVEDVLILTLLETGTHSDLKFCEK